MRHMSGALAPPGPTIPRDMSAASAPPGPTTTVRIRDAFFGESDALYSVELCVRALSDTTADPITTFGNVAIRNPLTCTLTTDGLCPFGADLRVLIPFSAMTVAQLNVVRAIATEMHTLNTTRYKHPNGMFSASCPRDACKVFLDTAVVLYALNVLIVRAVDGLSIDVATVVNVTQQRILASVNVHRSQVTRADQLTRAYVAARRALETNSVKTNTVV